MEMVLSHVLSGLGILAVIISVIACAFIKT